MQKGKIIFYAKDLQEVTVDYSSIKDIDINEAYWSATDAKGVNVYLAFANPDYKKQKIFMNKGETYDFSLIASFVNSDITKEFVYLSDTKIIDSNVVIKYGDNIKI